MVATEKEQITANEIVGQMTENEAAGWLRNDAEYPFDEPLWGWVERALTQMTLLIAGQPIVYAEAIENGEEGGARLVVFTDAAVIVSDVDEISSNASLPTTQIVPRSRIQSVTVRDGDKIVWDLDDDHTRNAKFRWPGKIRVSVIYEGLPAPVEISGTGANPYQRDQPTRIMRLITGLSADLTGSPPVVDGGAPA